PLPRGYREGRSTDQIMPALLFHQRAGGLVAMRDGTRGHVLNSGLRYLDQSWRIEAQPAADGGVWLDEAVLVARTPLVPDRVEEVARSGAAPSRLWLGALPGDRDTRPSASGYLNQESYVRAFLPVRRGGEGPKK